MKTSTLSVTLALLKPDLILRPSATKAVHHIILENQFYIVRRRRCKWSLNEAEDFYKEHYGRFYFSRLTSYMASGDFIALILARIDAIGKWRELIGPTRVYRTKVEAPNTIRGLYGLTDTRNSVHGSDSLENAIKEIEFIFTDFDYHQWLEVDEPYFREDKLTYDSELSTHIPCAYN